MQIRNDLLDYEDSDDDEELMALLNSSDDASPKEAGKKNGFGSQGRVRVQENKEL